MCENSERVWSRFEKRLKDGSFIRLRVQDCPDDRMEEVIDLMVKHFARDEAVHSAVGLIQNPQSVEEYTNYLKLTSSDPNHHVAICCSDDYDSVGDIMGISITVLTKDKSNWEHVLEIAKVSSNEIKKLADVFYDVNSSYDVLEQHNISSFYDDKAVLVLPQYRKLGIAQEFFKVRRLMCGAHGIPLTAAWMTGFGSQKAAERDGWETVYEVDYEALGRRHEVTFTDVPTTMKIMIGLPLVNKVEE